jgi:hypothetical protein
MHVTDVASMDKVQVIFLAEVKHVSGYHRIPNLDFDMLPGDFAFIKIEEKIQGATDTYEIRVKKILPNRRKETVGVIFEEAMTLSERFVNYAAFATDHSIHRITLRGYETSDGKTIGRDSALGIPQGGILIANMKEIVSDRNHFMKALDDALKINYSEIRYFNFITSIRRQAG